ncbi:MAG: hypothetical protein OM95_01545 [Bdellovibrio sp. ArHS]|uniref:hypothetical protein n=1 Tax=Bdellovibrio sp. ArHS TaxID=1569284 RepID=UPI000583E7FD|nr:hypothetical protein [Bdellovibrio sp. ArHS]KHD89783.1 MAG: hypothetical protein OM95_01545 [Bdellovibrio sp. ArHS]
MRFLIALITLTGSISFAEVKNFNGLVAETTQQEKRIHRKLLQSIQNVQVSIAYNDRIEKIQSAREPTEETIRVRLVSAE